MDPVTDASIAAELSTSPGRFLAAHSSGVDDALLAFDESWKQLCLRIEHAHSLDLLSPATVQLAYSVTKTITVLASQFNVLENNSVVLQHDLQDRAEDLLTRAVEDSTESPPKTTTLPFAWVEPLFEYLIDNMAYPYPDADEKQQLLDDANSAGWSAITLKKLDDWLGMTRARMGYTAILKSRAVADDHLLLADYVRRTLADSASEMTDIPETTVQQIRDMEQWILEQLDAKAAKEQTSPWAHEVLGLVQRLDAVGPIATRSTSVLEADDSEPSCDDAGFPSDDDETQYSDSSSDYSDTDVEPWVDEPLRGIIGIKRKYSGLQGLGFPTSSPLSRSSSSSSLSSRGRSIWSRRSSSGSTSASSVFSVDWEQEQREETDRPTKRRRSSVELPPYDPSSATPSPLEDKPSQPSPTDASSPDLLLHEATSPGSSSSPPSAQSPEPIPFPSSALFPTESPALVTTGSMQKRKRAASDDEDARPVVSKRRRHSASPPSIPMQHFTALGIIGHLPWDLPSFASSAVELELEAYALDSSPFAHGVAPESLDDADEEVEKEDDEEENNVYDRLVDYSNERMLEEVVEDGTPGTFTWSEMQLHVLDSILSYGARPTPATAARTAPLSSPQGFRLDLPSLDDDDLAYLLNIAAGPPIPPPAEMISPPLPSMDGQTFDLDLDVKPPLPESDVDNFVRMLQGWTSASAACPIRLEEPAPFADAEMDKWAFDFLAAASADLMTH